MSAHRFLNDIVKPWDELNKLLGERLALQPDLSDVTRLAGALAVAIRHQVDVADLKDFQVNAESPRRDGVCNPVAYVLYNAALSKRCGRSYKPPSSSRMTSLEGF